MPTTMNMDAIDFTDAKDPFSPESDENNPPDVIVRSSDNVDFHTHKTILSFGSPVFRDMFALPEPSGEEANQMRDGKPVVQLPETSKTVEKLLILCYPRFASSYSFRDLDGVDDAYVAADKYQITGGQKLLKELLIDPRFLQANPHRVYAIACHRGIRDVAKAAAVESLKLPAYVPNLAVPEFKMISAHQLRLLEDFHHRCSTDIADRVRASSAAVTDERVLDEDASVWWSTSNAGHSANCGATVRHLEDPLGGYLGTIVTPPAWFSQHIERAEQVLRTRPDTASIPSVINDLTEPTLKAMSECPKCIREGYNDLGTLARNTYSHARFMQIKILSKFSFVE
ncbi:hypothetical protein B0H10DRAFT_2092829 [Mycena sp. CBHHK59/15]|nr:hypothetical protein B0H10DRAFT_2092829 [Mycena sp. CBHHK59/15]